MVEPAASFPARKAFANHRLFRYIDEMSKAPPDYAKFITEWLSAGAQNRAPHCDAWVLHKRGTCKYCDLPGSEDLHVFREKYDVSHTGEADGVWPCPATKRRSLNIINKWHGNIPQPDAAINDEDNDK